MTLATPEATQIIYLRIPFHISLKEGISVEKNAFQDMLNVLQRQPGYKRMYWGRLVEKPEIVQLHIGTNSSFSLFPHSPRYCLRPGDKLQLSLLSFLVRETPQQHYDFLRLFMPSARSSKPLRLGSQLSVMP